MAEASLQRRIQMRATDLGARLFRNNQGVAEFNGQKVMYGVANPGGSDLIGWMTIKITQDMVGKPVAVWTAIEVKTKTGRPTEAQKRFLEVVRQAGGIAAICRSEEDLERVLGARTDGEGDA